VREASPLQRELLRIRIDAERILRETATPADSEQRWLSGFLAAIGSGNPAAATILKTDSGSSATPSPPKMAGV
jgi:hypothetical protein